MGATVVVFRKFKDGNREVIALFPEIPADYSGNKCESYMHVGQHGAADPWGVVRRSTAARPGDYAPLERELESIGYGRLVVKQKITSAMHLKRRERARDMRMSERAFGKL